jgi:hypothetical protein
MTVIRDPGPEQPPTLSVPCPPALRRVANPVGGCQRNSTTETSGNFETVLREDATPREGYREA